MEQITVRLDEELIEELDDMAEESNRSRAEVIRDELNSREDAEQLRSELERMQSEYESEIEYLENQVERLQRTNLKILEHREEKTDLQVYVDRRREWEEANWFTRQKWKFFGRG